MKIILDQLLYLYLQYIYQSYNMMKRRLLSSIKLLFFIVVIVKNPFTISASTSSDDIYHNKDTTALRQAALWHQEHSIHMYSDKTHN